ncbi:hypothetical protein BDZ91DRAFT_795083 [Kalaharituber pfeilii]|nr:hypothetical protein BDZ91DRAFT_795083 [Kalaharituber pfeilii]
MSPIMGVGGRSWLVSGGGGVTGGCVHTLQTMSIFGSQVEYSGLNMVELPWMHSSVQIGTASRTLFFGGAWLQDYAVPRSESAEKLATEEGIRQRRKAELRKSRQQAVGFKSVQRLEKHQELSAPTYLLTSNVSRRSWVKRIWKAAEVICRLYEEVEVEKYLEPVTLSPWRSA